MAYRSLNCCCCCFRYFISFLVQFYLIHLCETVPWNNNNNKANSELGEIHFFHSVWISKCSIFFVFLNLSLCVFVCLIKMDQIWILKKRTKKKYISIRYYRFPESNKKMKEFIFNFLLSLFFSF